MNDNRQEFYAPTIEEAVNKASAVTGVSEDQLSFEVLDRGSTGFLGIGARDARILVDYPISQPIASPAVEDTRSVESSEDEEISSTENFSNEEPPVTASISVSEVSLKSTQPEEDSATPASEVPYEVIMAVDEFMTSLMEAMGFDATVDAYDSGDVITVEVATKETGLFIGQKGETIDAIQYLLNVATYKNRPFIKRLVVDSEGYRQRRIEAIQGMAHRTARRALREKRPVDLPPMSPAERRVVHLFLQENPGVTTSSDGDEEDRRVIVSPT